MGRVEMVEVQEVHKMSFVYCRSQINCFPLSSTTFSSSSYTNHDLVAGAATDKGSDLN